MLFTPLVSLSGRGCLAKLIAARGQTHVVLFTLLVGGSFCLKLSERSETHVKWADLSNRSGRSETYVV